MLWLVLGGLALFVFWGGLRAFERASVTSIKSLVAWIAALGGISLALLLILTGRGGLAIAALVLFGPMLWQHWRAAHPGTGRGPGGRAGGRAGGAGAGGAGQAGGRTGPRSGAMNARGGVSGAGAAAGGQRGGHPRGASAADARGASGQRRVGLVGLADQPGAGSVVAGVRGVGAGRLRGGGLVSAAVARAGRPTPAIASGEVTLTVACRPRGDTDRIRPPWPEPGVPDRWRSVALGRTLSVATRPAPSLGGITA